MADLFGTGDMTGIVIARCTKDYAFSFKLFHKTFRVFRLLFGPDLIGEISILHISEIILDIDHGLEVFEGNGCSVNPDHILRIVVAGKDLSYLIKRDLTAVLFDIPVIKDVSVLVKKTVILKHPVIILCFLLASHNTGEGIYDLLPVLRRLPAVHRGADLFEHGLRKQCQYHCDADDDRNSSSPEAFHGYSLLLL